MAALVVIPIAIAVLVVIFTFWKLRSVFGQMGLGSSKKKRAQAERLLATGQKCRATILNIRPTGVVVNHINIQCDVDLMLAPIDGSPSFRGTKQMLVNQTQMPAVATVIPAWVNPQDRTEFAIRMPDGLSPDQIPTYREFGIPHPLDTPQQQDQPQAAPTAPARGSGLDELERLAQLRRQRSISEEEFEAGKARLLG